MSTVLVHVKEGGWVVVGVSALTHMCVSFKSLRGVLLLTSAGNNEKKGKEGLFCAQTDSC